MKDKRYVLVKNKKKTETLINFSVDGQAAGLSLPPRGSVIILSELVSDMMRVQQKTGEIEIREYIGIV